MNKVVCFLVIIIVLILGIVIFDKSTSTVWITDHEYLYDKAIEYIINENTMKDYDSKIKQNFKIFADYKGFGIEEKNDKKYAYMWILEEAYYESGNTIEQGTGSSMPYKFVFKDEEVIDYEIPRDGSEYGPSIKKMLPKSIFYEVISFHLDDTNLRKQIKEYYSHIDLSNDWRFKDI